LAPIVGVTAAKPQATTPAAAAAEQAARKPQHHHKAKDKRAVKVAATKHAVSRHAKAKPVVAAAPSPADPTFVYALPGPAPIGVPNFFIDSFRIPPFLLPIYQAAGTQYGVRWEVLAAINEIETDYGRNLGVSSAGATGWMQFIPGSWRLYGVDANRDGHADPYNPVDAIFAAARYLQAAGAATDLRAAIFAYNHADWYVTAVLDRAQRLAALPADLVGALTGLADGRPPVLGRTRPLADRTHGPRRSLLLRVRDGAPAVAVTDGRVLRIGRSARLGRFVQLQDVFGNVYTYGQLATLARRYPVLRRPLAATQTPPSRPEQDARPTLPATAGTQLPALAARSAAARAASTAARASQARPVAALVARRSAVATAAGGRQAHARPSTAMRTAFGGPLAAIDWADRARRLVPAGAGGAAGAAVPAGRDAATTTATGYDRRLLGGVPATLVAHRPLREGSRVVAGTILGRAARASTRPARVRFEIRPAGRAAPRIDPRPIVAGWKLLQASAGHAAALRPGEQPSIGEVLLLDRAELQRLVLANPAIAIYPCGREDIRAGRIDRRVLATLQLLALSGLSPTVSSLRCGHGYLTASGNVSEHASGNAVDISAINGIPILGHQGPGSITDTTIRRLLTLQGAIRPHQIISLMRFEGETNTLALADHADHIHVGFAPLQAPGSLAARLSDGVLTPRAWRRLIGRLAAIDNPRVATTRSADALAVRPAATP
ncbi:MAG: hypothetical protein QOJ35_1603, partial [Solirubrobacteraceae bacterium]|nr:hypothetical protein [Solirubrobacteraceae bacterium]